MNPRSFTVLFFAVFTAAVFLSDKGQIEGDGSIRWEALQLWAEKGGLCDDKYSMAQAVFARPLYEAGRLQASLTGAKGQRRENHIRQWVQRFNKFLVLAFGGWLWVVFRKWAGGSPSQTAWALLFFTFGSLIIPHAKDFYSELLWTFLALLGITGLCQRGGVSMFLVIFGISTSILLNPVLAPVWSGMGILLYLYRERKNLGPSNFRWFPTGKIFQMVAAVLLGILLMGMENLVRRGSVSDFGYPGEGFNTPFLRGLAGQIFAPARGILFFLPTFLLAGCAVKKVSSREHLSALLIYGFLFSVLLVCAYSTWHAWHGAWYWGPRFLLPLSVFGTLYYVICLEGFSAYSTLRKIILIVLGVISFAVYKVGVSIGHAPLMECLEIHRLTDHCYWQWRYTPLASWINPEDLRTLFRHHSSVVFAGALAFTALLTCRINQRSSD